MSIEIGMIFDKGKVFIERSEKHRLRQEPIKRDRRPDRNKGR